MLWGYAKYNSLDWLNLPKPRPRRPYLFYGPALLLAQAPASDAAPYEMGSLPSVRVDTSAKAERTAKERPKAIVTSRHKLHCPNSRGRMEFVKRALAAAGAVPSPPYFHKLARQYAFYSHHYWSGSAIRSFLSDFSLN